MKVLTGYFDGQKVVLDEPATLKLNSRVTVIAAEEDESEPDLTRAFAAASEPAFAAIWENSLDADYDKI